MEEMIIRGITQLLGRLDGPMHMRLILQPLMASILAIRAGIRDAREGNPAYLSEILTNPSARKRLLQHGWKDFGKIFIAAFILDTVYQIIALRFFYPVQALIVALVLATVPYILLRGPATHIARLFYKKRKEQDYEHTENSH